MSCIIQMIKKTKSNIKTKKRPLGVWILTIYSLIFAGILPLIIVLSFILIGINSLPVLNIEILNTLLILVLTISIITFSILTWKGNNKARITLIILVSIYYIGVSLNNIFILQDLQQYSLNSDIESVINHTYGVIIRGFLYSGIYIWYFLRKKTLRFYE